MSFRDLLKRQVENLVSTDRDQPNVSLEQDLQNQFDSALTNTIDPGHEQREAAREAEAIERTRTQPGLGQFVTITGIAGDWEAVEMSYWDETSNAFILVDRRTGETAQLAAVDDGTVILDSPRDQHGATIPGAFWRVGNRTGIRLSGAQLGADGTRFVNVTCELSAEVPAD